MIHALFGWMGIGHAWPKVLPDDAGAPQPNCQGLSLLWRVSHADAPMWHCFGALSPTEPTPRGLHARAPCKCFDSPPPPPSVPPPPHALPVSGVSETRFVYVVGLMGLVGGLICLINMCGGDKGERRSVVNQSSHQAEAKKHGGGKRSLGRKLLNVARRVQAFTATPIGIVLVAPLALLVLVVVAGLVDPTIWVRIGYVALPFMPSSVRNSISASLPPRPPSPPPSPPPPPSPTLPPPTPPPLPPINCDSNAVSGGCWHLTRAGETCATACGAEPPLLQLGLSLLARFLGTAHPEFYFADDETTSAHAASHQVVKQLSERYGLLDVQSNDPSFEIRAELKAALDAPAGTAGGPHLNRLGECGGGVVDGFTPAYVYLYLPELATWDCYDNPAGARIGSAFRQPCLCKPAPPVESTALAVALGLLFGLGLCVLLAVVGCMSDALCTPPPAAPMEAATPPAKRIGRFSSGSHSRSPSALHNGETGGGGGTGGWGLAWRSKVLIGGTVLHLLDLGTDGLALVSFVSNQQWEYVTASAAFLALAILATYVYTSIEHAPLLRPEVGDTVSMSHTCGAYRGRVGKVVALEMDAHAAMRAEQQERAEAIAAAAAAAARAEEEEMVAHEVAVAAAIEKGKPPPPPPPPMLPPMPPPPPTPFSVNMAFPYRIEGEDGKPIMRYPLQPGILLHTITLSDLEGMTKHYDADYGDETSEEVRDASDAPPFPRDLAPQPAVPLSPSGLFSPCPISPCPDRCSMRSRSMPSGSLWALTRRALPRSPWAPLGSVRRCSHARAPTSHTGTMACGGTSPRASRLDSHRPMPSASVDGSSTQVTRTTPLVSRGGFMALAATGPARSLASARGPSASTTPRASPMRCVLRPLSSRRAAPGVARPLETVAIMPPPSRLVVPMAAAQPVGPLWLVVVVVLSAPSACAKAA